MNEGRKLKLKSVVMYTMISFQVINLAGTIN